MTAAQLETMMTDGRPLIIVDVRSTSEFAAGHLPGSVNIPLDELPAHLDELDASVPVVVVCGSGSRSVRGAKLLLDAGYRDVYNLIGGLATWNGELEKSG
ncbi:MAG: rhodanese-like domain-containing protein [Armatimonadota bacterium]